MGFDIHGVWFRNDMLGSMWSRNKRMWSRNCFCSFCYVDSIFACFYLTGQLKSTLQNFQLAGVVLVVSNPHVFNLTGQLESKPPEFPILAATDPSSEDFQQIIEVVIEYKAAMRKIKEMSFRGSELHQLAKDEVVQLGALRHYLFCGGL
jgi:hypothetical protein